MIDLTVVIAGPFLKPGPEVQMLEVATHSSASGGKKRGYDSGADSAL
jgi:hypothetical protein